MKEIIVLDSNTKIIKLPEENSGKTSANWKLGRDFLYGTSKALTIKERKKDKLELIETLNLMFSKDTVNKKQDFSF